MSRFEGNPFEDDTPSNPYAGSSAPSAKTGRTPNTTGGAASFFDNAVAQKATNGANSSGAKMTPLPPESRSGSAFDAAGDMPYSPRKLRQKQKELQDREAALRRKEQELSSREEALGIVRPNWPPFFPLIRHDIPNDIPEHLRATQRAAFVTWLGAMLCLVYNFIAVTLAWIVGAVSATSGVGNFFLALVFMILGVPLSYFLWYRRLYNSLKNDSGFGLVLFFCSYLSHCLWFTYFSIAPPIIFGGKFVCGVMTTIEMFGSNGFIGIMYAIGTALFITELILSVFVILRVYAYFRGANKQDQLRQEAAMSALRNAV